MMKLDTEGMQTMRTLATNMAFLKIIVAIDSFKGCLTSKEANQAAAEGILLTTPGTVVTQMAVSDGGEGWTEAFQAALGGTLVDVSVRDPLMRPIVAQYLTKGDKAVIEMAKASGLTLLAPHERNPMVATSYGTGQLIADAVRRGCKDIIVGLGGSATSDCGIGMLRAIIDAFARNGLWDDVHDLDHVRFTIATDVTNPLCGENGAAHVFGPQKFGVKRQPLAHASSPQPDEGEMTEMIRRLDARARLFAERSARHFGYDRQNSPGAGAAGGLGYAFMQYMNAECRPGIDLLLETAGFDEMLKDAYHVVTGEGSADRQTLMGKLPFGILQWAKARHVPVTLIAGRISHRQLLLNAGFCHVECINPPGLPIEEAMKPETAKRNIINTMACLLNEGSF
jgi:glycerate kinase